ncbi:sirohydrochlorin cobaltochelatase-like protein [Leptospira weilii str. LNT 1234]|nr:sirohydrochlorin cobaltochelatase-like protein [Leptospira weilii str. LNT 1234]
MEFAKTKNRILIFPLFLFASNHVKNEIPLILSDLKEKFPNHRFISAMPLGIHENIIRFEVGDTYVFLPRVRKRLLFVSLKKQIHLYL